MEIIKGIILIIGCITAINFLGLGYTISRMSKEDYRRLQRACRTEEGWKNFWKYYER